MPSTATCVPPVSTEGPARSADSDLNEFVRTPWPLRVGASVVLIRPATSRDLQGVAQMHGRCTARSLLDRYRSGGRPPGVIALDKLLREPCGVVASLPDGSVVALGTLVRDPNHGTLSAQIGLLVQDSWQRMGIGAELSTHLAGVAQAAGYHELISYPATALPAVQRLMTEVGRTRLVRDVDLHLHTYLPDSATLGLGPVRQRLAG
jgi:GNAT superfamily N-acetyltransferase